MIIVASHLAFVLYFCLVLDANKVVGIIERTQKDLSVVSPHLDHSSNLSM